MKLCESIKIGTMTLNNRLVMPPMATGKAGATGLINDAICGHYAQRAIGGKIGMIITEHFYIAMQGKASEGQISLAEDSVIEPMQKLTEVIKVDGTKVIAQLNHAGSAANASITGEPIVSASAVANPSRKAEFCDNVLPRELTAAEIAALQDAYAAAAVRAKAAGYDGVEIHSAHGYLLNQFYSPLTNHRHDSYGCDSIANRVRFHIETIRKVREAVGEDFPILVRLGGCDYMEGGSTIQDAVEAAKLLEAAGADAIDLSGGMCRYMRPDSDAHGYFGDMAAAVTKEVQIPVILTGGFHTAAQCEEYLLAGACDLVGVGRKLFAEADWARRELAE